MYPLVVVHSGRSFGMENFLKTSSFFSIVLIIIITFPYSTCIALFWQQHSYFFVYFSFYTYIDSTNSMIKELLADIFMTNIPLPISRDSNR